MLVKIDEEQIDEMVVTNMKESIAMILEEPYYLYHDTKRALMLVDSFVDVLGYYMLDGEHVDYVKSLDLEKLKNSIEILSVIDNPDGSANVSFDATLEQAELLAGEGFKYLLTKAAFSVNDEQLTQILLKEKNDV